MDTQSKRFSIVDAHQHFWDPTVHYYPWLCDSPPVPFRYGDYHAIRRPYLPADYLQDASRYQVDASVYVEAEWDPRDPLGEMRYIKTLREKTAYPSVAVAHTRLDRPAAQSTLEQLAEFDFVRGVRHKPRANPAPGDTAPGAMTEAPWRSGFSLLARYGLRLDLQTPWWHLHEAVDLARCFPDIPIVLNHTGLPADRSPEGLAAWRTAMASLAGCANASVKISGLGVPGAKWTAEANRQIVLTTIELFGSDRCMFASNFPVDSLCATFDEIFNGFEEIVSGCSAHEKQQLFRDNAIRLYAIA